MDDLQVELKKKLLKTNMTDSFEIRISVIVLPNPALSVIFLLFPQLTTNICLSGHTYLFSLAQILLYKRKGKSMQDYYFHQ